MTFTIDQVKRLCPEFEIMVHKDGSFNMINFGSFLVPDSGPGLLLLTTRQHLEIARAALEVFRDNRLHISPVVERELDAVRKVASEALDTIAKADQ